MKKILCAVLLLTSCFIWSEEKAEKPTEEKTKEKELKIIPLPPQKELQRSIMIVQPKDKASDFIKAFELLKKEKPSSKIYYKLYSNRIINNIIDTSMLENGTLILFKIATSQGTKLIIVPVEEIEEIGHI